MLLFSLDDKNCEDFSNFDFESVVTPINVREFSRLLHLSGFNRVDAEFLIDGFQNGFDIGYRGPENCRSRSNNLPFNVGNRSILWGKLMKEVSLGRVAGLFSEVPFENFIQSPIGLVPKDGGDATRLIFHLSYEFPDGMHSLNYHTPKELTSVKYNDLDHTVSLCLKLVDKFECEFNTKPILYFSKADGWSAFRMLPLNRLSWRWVVMKATSPGTGQMVYFVEKCLPFGSSISCALFQKLSDALKHLHEFLTETRDCLSNYLDDFLFLAITRYYCNQLLQAFIDLCKRINFPLAPEKVEQATTRLVFLGILLDGKFLLLFVPLQKKIKVHNLIESFINKKCATVAHIQSLCGFLNFLNKAIFPGRAFTRRMYAKYSHLCDSSNLKLKPHHHVAVDCEFRTDCRIWKLFLDLGDTAVTNRPMVDLARMPAVEDVSFYSDASANPELGFGCIFHNSWIFQQWEQNFVEKFKPTIEYLELYALVAGFFTWEFELRDCCILVHCDNQVVVAMINNGSSSCKHCMVLIRLLTLNGLQFNRRVFAKYVIGKSNKLSDSLSRLKIKLFKKLAPTINEFPDKTNPRSGLYQDCGRMTHLT